MIMVIHIDWILQKYAILKLTVNMLINFIFQFQMPRKVRLLVKLKKIGRNFVSNLSVYGISKIARSNNFLAGLAWTIMTIYYILIFPTILLFLPSLFV